MIGNRGTEIGLEKKNNLLCNKEETRQRNRESREEEEREGKEKLFGGDTSIYMHCLPFLSNSDDMKKSGLLR